MPLLLGDKLGPYEILAPIGAGGMGEVYRAKDPRLNRDVAIKVSTQFSNRFEAEAKAIAALNHPNICQIYDVGPNYLVMELVSGEPLKGPETLETVLAYARQIADALEAAHDRGVIHRDLKPANILVTKGVVKLLDFGIAKVAHNGTGDETVTQTHAGTIVGTAPYMSPEQAEGKLVDLRSDIFSFGIVLYELIAGRRPFGGETVVSILAAILREEPPPIEAPEDLLRIVKRCLCKKPAGRWQSMGELKAALCAVSLIPRERMPSIAVLPFVDMSPSKGNEYFGDGLAEDIISALTHIPNLKVIARTSSFAFKDKTEDVRKIGEILGVANILEGSIRCAGNRIRVAAQLVTAAEGTHLWSERYDRELTDIFAIQEEISLAIADALKVELVRTASVGGIPRQANLEAYRACLEGRLHSRNMTPGGMARALECFQRAIRLDPTYAFPHTALAQRGHFQAVYLGVRPREVVPDALAAADRALQLDAEAAQAYVVRGMIRAYFEFNWRGAGEDFMRALQINPSSAGAISGRAFWHLAPLGREGEALAEIRRSQELDPRNLFTWVAEVLTLGLMGNHEEEVLRGQVMVELFFGFWIAWYQYGIALCFQGAHEKAISAFEKGLAITPGNVYLLAMVALSLGRLGRSLEADRIRADIEQKSAQRYVSYLARALACEGAGDVNRAYELVGKANDERDPQALTFLAYRRRELKLDRRYRSLLARMNLL